MTSHCPRASIPEGITELWKKYFLAKDSHDLTIETGDGQVTAHAQMLKEASPVVRAMLESPMKEGQTHWIEVKDTSSSAVSLFLEFLGDATQECFQSLPLSSPMSNFKPARLMQNQCKHVFRTIPNMRSCMSLSLIYFSS